MPAFTTLQLASPYDFKLCKEAPNPLLIRAYFFQLLNSGFGLANGVQEKIVESGLVQNELPDSFIEQVLNSQELIPEFFYFFSKESLQSEMSTFDFDIYTDIINISFDQGGLLVMECFRNQIYVLCTSNGDVITDHCHDLDLGLNGLIHYRSSHIDGDFESAVYRKSTGQLEPSDLAMNIIENFVYNGLNWRRDYLPFQFEPYLSEGEFEFLQGRGDLSWLKDALKNNEVNWVCAPWLVEKYHSDKELVLAAIKVDYKVFSLLQSNLQHDVEILREFIISAPFQYFYACYLTFALPEWPLNNREYCLRWVTQSSSAFEFISEEMKLDEEIVSLNNTRIY
jgi:hypothetical protein